MARETLDGDVKGQGSNPTGKYTIGRGDNLTKIALKQLGPNASNADIQAMIQKIAKENNISDVNRIQAGAQLRLPPNANMGPAPGSASPPTGAPSIDSSLAGAPSPGPALGPAPGSAPPGAMRGAAPPASFPVPDISTGGGMPGPGPTITPPTADQIKVSPAMPPMRPDDVEFIKQMKPEMLKVVAMQSEHPGYRKLAQQLLAQNQPPAAQRGGFSFTEDQVNPPAESSMYYPPQPSDQPPPGRRPRGFSFKNEPF